VIIFNHASQLDGYVTLGLLPRRGVTVIKSQFLRYPFVGMAVRLLDFVTIDRSAPAKGRRSIEHLAERVTRKGLAVLIAPEGTRSRTGDLLP
jgi:1-acyl-sn-glycerol-3-phosphate acyltransferase